MSSIISDMQRHWLVLVALVVPLFGFGKTPQAADGATTIRLSRTACLGTCPIYSVELHEDGTVSYHGGKFVRVKGRQESKVDAREVQDLLAEFARINFFGLEDSYTERKNSNGTVSILLDAPSTYIYLRQGGREKSVEDYFGAPDELKPLQKRIDEVAGTQKWVFIDSATVMAMAKSGWSAKKNGHKYLDEAVRWRDAELVSALLELGASPNEQAKDGSLPLVSAAGIGDERLCELLLQHGASVNGVSQFGEGDSPLASAARYGNGKLVERLLALGADVNLLNKTNSTALMAAAATGNREIVLRLLAAGANPNVVSKYGHTARTWLEEPTADKPPVEEIIAILKSAEQK